MFSALIVFVIVTIMVMVLALRVWAAVAADSEQAISSSTKRR